MPTTTAIPLPPTPRAPTDPALVERARLGVPDAFGSIVESHDRRLRVLARRYLRDEAKVDDALQDAYLKAFQAMGRYRGDADIGIWLHRITTNVCLDHLRRERRWSGRTEAMEDVAGEVASTTAGPAERAACRSQLSSALDSLPAALRAPVVLVDGYGFDYTEASTFLGIAPGTVGSRLNRARRRLRREFLAAA